MRELEPDDGSVSSTSGTVLRCHWQDVSLRVSDSVLSMIVSVLPCWRGIRGWKERPPLFGGLESGVDIVCLKNGMFE
jgi:hypothetical protein